MRRLAVIVCALLAATACSGRDIMLEIQAPPTMHEEPGGFEAATVERVVDGDTIVVRITGKAEGPAAGDARVGASYPVRLIGIDTPESVDPRRPVECFGREAAAAAGALLAGRTVRLVRDVEEMDRYDRLLRYVYLGDEMVNARLVANGYATAYTYPPNIRHSNLFVQLQREARDEERGLWSPDTCNG